MESKHILRIGCILSVMLLFSVYNSQKHMEKHGRSQQTSLDSFFPYNGVFHLVSGVFDQAIHSDGKAKSIEHVIFPQKSPAVVSGVVNEKPLWQVKIGPFYDMAQIEQLTGILLQKNLQVLVKVNLNESGYNCTAYVQPTVKKAQAEILRKELAVLYPQLVSIADDYL